MKKLLICLFAVVFISSFSIIAFAYENSVDDSADLFNQSEEAEILEKAGDFSNATQLSLCIATSDENHGLAVSEYADSYIDNLIDNRGWSENCVLFLIDMYNREVYISLTGNAEYSFDSFSIECILDNGYYELGEGNYAEAVLLMIASAADEFGFDYSYDDSYDYDDDYEYNYEYDYDYDDNYESDSFEITDIFIYVVIALVIAAIAVFTVKKKYKNFGKGDEFDAEDVILNITGSNDNVVSRNVITTKIPRNNNRTRPGGMSGRGFSGGRSHGGGGRKF